LMSLFQACLVVNDDGRYEGTLLRTGAESSPVHRLIMITVLNAGANMGQQRNATQSGNIDMALRMLVLSITA